MESMESIECISTYLEKHVCLVSDLGRLYIVLSDEVEHQLRLAAVVRLGGKKGDLSGAIELAVKDWLGKKSKNRKSS
jgi:hypothetical protein